MAEVKNAFIKSKMNKDLDDRLIPSGEYRDAVNVQVSKSEGSDVGSLENVLGNIRVADFEPTVEELSSIGCLADELNSDIYVFLTNNPNSAYNPLSKNFIYKYNSVSGLNEKLVEGAFLNFSKLNPIHGVNLLEDLLFWTDNRNQPRKINVKLTNNATYYTVEDNISVAKYNPYQSIQLFEESQLSAGDHETTMKDVVSKALPYGGTCETASALTVGLTSFAVRGVSFEIYPNQPRVGAEIKHINPVTGALESFDPPVYVSTFTPAEENPPVAALLGVSPAIPEALPLKTLLVVDPNPYYEEGYNGDEDFLEDKFARFSYRFKYVDGEYSIMAPFTQPCFIPKQDGYFVNNSVDDGDEKMAYNSTIVGFMENKVNKITLMVPLPSEGSSLSSDLHVSEIDILYKESDSLAVKVVETIPIIDLASLNDKVYKYDYQAQKPYKTLPNSETIRVYDKVPVKALAQEVISNRVVYGNYQNKTTPPAFINYNVNATDKSSFNLKKATGTVNGAVSDDNVVNLINASPEDNVDVGSLVTGVGIPTSPKTVIISKTDGVSPALTLNQNVTLADGIELSFELIGDETNTTSVIEYPSSSLKTNRSYQAGFVLSDKFGRQSTVILSSNKDSIRIGDSYFLGSTLYSSYKDSDYESVEWPGDSIKILVNDPIDLGGNSYNDEIDSLSYNPLGWYSYKIVVKQTEQEYYNVYTAGAMKALPFNNASNSITPLIDTNKSFVTLINDNINKVPRDLSEVGPQDKTFRSSVVLHGRVENTLGVSSNNSQYFPGRNSFTTSSIEDLQDMFDVGEFTGGGTSVIPITDTANAYYGFYKSDSNPFIAEIITSQLNSGTFGINNNVTSSIGEATTNSTTNGQTDISVSSTYTGVIEKGSSVTWPQMPIGLRVVVESVELDASPYIVYVNQNVTIPNGTVLSFNKISYSTIETLAVLETDPVQSRLDIFWETSTSGLISNLNSIIEDNAGASSGIAPFNTNPFTENIEADANILQAPFRLVDSFGIDITIGIESFELVSVVNGVPPSVGVNVNEGTSPYFILDETAPGSFEWNIRVTQECLNNVYYGSNANSRYFTFTFRSVVNGVTTNIQQSVLMSNESPTITPSQDFEIQSNTVTPIIAKMTATNGANIDDNPNKYSEITWSIDSAISSTGLNTTGFFEIVETGLGEQPVYDYQRNLVVANIALPGSSMGIPADTYTITVSVADAGQVSETLTITARLGVVISSGYPKEKTVSFSGVEYTYVEFLVENIVDPSSWNGTYIYNGSATSGLDYDNAVTIQMQNPGACINNWSFNSNRNSAFNTWMSCNGLSGIGNPINESTLSTSGKLFEVIG